MKSITRNFALLSLMFIASCSGGGGGSDVMSSAEQVTEGMTKSEVVALLGEPDSSDGVFGTEMMFYPSGQSIVVVLMNDGKATSVRRDSETLFGKFE